ncbi:hypothetical protein EJV47_14855 [Hymenobacter gummosus]|uniref:Uncharacterized protein n=1 Tax=Hymenobacter gummosus TaxID=1776032 RepID=A0A3S0H5L3_9BACT|nr:hypothetical protein [Hymenobacter gummosus]RTQ48874.1 hypothetical protein EJV47_14855 [Hymenobacter gummosus]
MSPWHLLWIGPLFIGGFAALWAFVSKVLSWLGWQRLADEYAVAAAPPSEVRLRLSWAKLGLVDYKNVIEAGLGPEGLSLTVPAIFRIGHPALLIPWAALGPVHQRRQLWNTHYQLSISTAGRSVPLAFRSEALAQALRPWLVEAATAE